MPFDTVAALLFPLAQSRCDLIGACLGAIPIYPQAAFGREDLILASKPSDSQDEMPQGSYPSNPNATGECKSGWYKPHTTGTFDDNYDQDGGLGQITTKINDGYPFKDGDVLKMKGTT